MDYEKKYKEALETARKINSEEGVAAPPDWTICEVIFPELKKSKEKKIIEAIVAHIKDMRCYDIYYGVTPDEMIAWLEKQGDKPANSIVETWKDMRLEVYQQASGNRHELNYSDDTTKMFSLNDIDEIIEKISEQKPALRKRYETLQSPWFKRTHKDMSVEIDDEPQGKSAIEAINEEKVDNANKVEPKFKVGDWVVCEITGSVYQIKNCIENLNNHRYGYNLIDGGYISSDEVNHYHLWTIQDAKDGDVLMSRTPFIYGEQCPYGGLNWYNNKFIKASNFIFTDSPVHPATKKQHDLLIQKIKEAGYEWDAEKKELRKIEKQGD